MKPEVLMNQCLHQVIYMSCDGKSMLKYLPFTVYLYQALGCLAQ